MSRHAPERPIVTGIAQRRLVFTTLVLLLIPGVIGFDLWPLTAWRLFSFARTDRMTTWEIHAADSGGRSTVVGLDTLPLGFQLAEWPMAGLVDATGSRRTAVCAALLEAVKGDRPETVQLDIVRNDRRLVRQDGGWVEDSDRQVFHSCRRRR